MSQKNQIAAPVSGKCVELSQVPDPMFADKIMGDGVAFIYEGDTIYSPCDGEIQVVAETKHAVGITSVDGLEILIHIGVETVKLNGQGFEALVKQGQKVKTGTPLLKVDRSFMEEKGVNLITAMVVTNGAEYDYQVKTLGQDVKQGKTEIITYSRPSANVKETEKGSEFKNMKYEKLCKDIIQCVGGKGNVTSVTHCVTRLRFKLKDVSKADTESLNKMSGVMKVIQTGGQYQVVIGTHVDAVYNELIQIGGFKTEAPVAAAEDDEEEQKGVISKFLVLMSGIFQPILSILMASGMIKALLSLLTLAGILDNTSGTYIILSSLGDALFYFFPVAVGWSSAKKFGIKEIYGITLGACLSYPSIVALSSAEPLYTLFAGTMFESNVYTKFLGIPVLLPGAGYSGSVIPIILIVWVASIIFKFFTKHLPAMIRSFFVPFLTLLITFPLAMVIVGPVAMFIQSLLGGIIQFVVGLNTGIAGLVIGSCWSVLVMFGLHMPIIMMFNVNIQTYGYDVINPLIFSGALATMGSVLGIIIRTKSAEERNIAVPALFSTFFGVNEPSLYGVLIPRKKVLFSCFLSAGIGSMIAGFCGAKLYAFGASGPLGLPCFINPAGIDMGFIGLCIGAVVSFALALISSLIIGDKKDANTLKLGAE